MSEDWIPIIFGEIPTITTLTSVDVERSAPRNILRREIPLVDKVYFNNKHTTILWADGEKTTVGCADDQQFDEYAGFAAAVLKRLYGSSRAAINCMNAHKVVQQPKEKKQRCKDGVKDA